MGMFGKKEEEKKESETCCCGNCDCETMEKAEEAKTKGARIKILGGGCSKCQALEEATKEALEELRMNEMIAHVTYYSEIASYGVMSTPALVVDGKVVSYGKVLKKEEVIKLLQNNS